jgi:hypothetical protein
VALSEARLQRLVDGDSAAIRKMGWFDSFKDTVFHGGSKRAALTQLAQEFDASRGTSALDRFIRLASMAQPVDRSQFTVGLDGSADQSFVHYRIKDLTVKTEPLNPPDRDVILARLGQVRDFNATDNARSADWLSAYERQDLSKARSEVTDADFGSGGVHKRFHKESGILRAEDNVGESDFLKEAEIAQVASNSPDVSRYVSTQKRIESHEMAATLPNIQSDKAHATVPLYDSAHVHSNELDQEIGNLTSDQARSLLMQTVDMARVFYKSGIAHRDLHMHNLMVYRPQDPAEGQITLKAIDFGKSKVDVANEKDKLTDLKYLFHKEASRFGETTLRGARERFGVNVERQAKHYPVHKLLAQCARSGGNEVGHSDLDPTVRGVGDRLIQDLSNAERLSEELRPAAIDEAFNQAMSSLSQVAGNLARPRVESHVLWG